MSVVEWIEMTPSSFTAIPEVSNLMDMEAMEPWRQSINKSFETRFDENISMVSLQ